MNIVNIIPIIISCAALLISFLSYYYSHVQKGKVKMTKPTTFFLGCDGVKQEHVNEKKVYVRMLLYSTSEKGQYIQNMFVRLKRGESVQNFNVWVYGEKEFTRGSGLYLNKQGITTNHHFLLPKGTTYDFPAGEYNIQIFVEPTNKIPYKIFEQDLVISNYQHDDLDNRIGGGVFYDWAPNSRNYDSHVAGQIKKERLY